MKIRAEKEKAEKEKAEKEQFNKDAKEIKAMMEQPEKEWLADK